MKRNSIYVFLAIGVVLAFVYGCVEGLLGPGNGPGNGQDNHPPDDPQCLKPEDGATNVSVNTLLEWSCSDPDGDQLTYEVYICPDGEEWIRIDDGYVDGTQCDLPFTLDYETWYYWYVVATDPGGLSSEPDNDWTFQTEPATGTPPDTPSLIYPENGQTDVELRPTFRWSATMSLGGAPFENVPPRPTNDKGGISRDSSSPSASTINATVTNSATSATIGTNQAVTAQPPTPRIQYGGEGYEPLSPADSYRIQVDDNSDFSSPKIDVSGITDNAYKPSSDLGEHKTYYWRVRAHNQWGDSSWSTVWHFTTGGGGGTPPDAPTLIYPQNGKTDVELRPTFRWTVTMSLGGTPFENVPTSTSNVVNQALNARALIRRIRQSIEGGYNPLSPADSYRIQVDNNSDFSSPKIDKSGITDNQYRHTSDLDKNTRYYWRVRAHNEWGDSSWSSVWSFTTTEENNPPNPPSNPVPANGAGDVPVTTNLQWQCSDPDGDTLNYDVYFGTTTTPPLVASRITTKNWDPPGNLDYDQVYHWYIIARDTHEDTTEGPHWNFTTETEGGNQPPGPFDLQGPVDTSSGVDMSHHPMQWEASVDPDDDTVTYTVYWGTSPGSYPNSHDCGTGTSYAPDLSYNGTKYYWKVTASDGRGGTRDSDEWEFTTHNNSAPGQVTLQSPANHATGVSRYPFHNWSDKPYCWYYIQVSLYSDFHLMEYSYSNSYDDPRCFGGPAGSQYDNDWFQLDPYTKYYWRVRTLNDWGLGPWSAVFDFTTGS